MEYTRAMEGRAQGRIDLEMFRKFCALVYQHAGIKLGAQKEALVCARLGKRMRALGIEEFRDYYALIAGDKTGTELVHLLDAISTNVTQFFRGDKHFSLLAHLLREWEGQGQTRFRIWCTAASTGEEPYSAAMIVRETLRDARDALILATDLSTQALTCAREGVYENRRTEQVPRSLKAKYFMRRPGSEPETYAVRDEIKRHVKFGRINLANPPFPLRGPLDVIFCRNVMIYFDDEVRRRLLRDLHRLLKPGGYLLVGQAESLSGMLSSFRPVAPAVYVK